MTNATTATSTEHLKALNDESLSALLDYLRSERSRRREIKDCVSRINAILDTLAGLVSEHDHINIVDEFSGEMLVMDYGHDDHRILGKNSQSIFKITIE